MILESTQRWHLFWGWRLVCAFGAEVQHLNGSGRRLRLRLGSERIGSQWCSYFGVTWWIWNVFLLNRWRILAELRWQLCLLWSTATFSFHLILLVDIFHEFFDFFIWNSFFDGKVIFLLFWFFFWYSRSFLNHCFSKSWYTWSKTKIGLFYWFFFELSICWLPLTRCFLLLLFIFNIFAWCSFIQFLNRLLAWNGAWNLHRALNIYRWLGWASLWAIVTSRWFQITIIKLILFFSFDDIVDELIFVQIVYFINFNHFSFWFCQWMFAYFTQSLFSDIVKFELMIIKIIWFRHMLGQRIRLLLRHSTFSFFINFNFKLFHILKNLIIISCYETVFTFVLILVEVLDYLFNSIIQTDFILNIHHVIVSDSISCFSDIAFESV